MRTETKSDELCGTRYEPVGDYSNYIFCILINKLA